MNIDEAIGILERWHGGGFATRIEDINPAVSLGIEALNRVIAGRNFGLPFEAELLPGETEE